MLDFGFRNTVLNYAFPLYVHLYSVAPTAPALTATGSELFGNGYARHEVTFGSASGGAVSNLYDLKWKHDSGTSPGSWDITYLVIRDKNQGAIGGQPIDPPIRVSTYQRSDGSWVHEVLTIRSGALVVSFESEPDDNE